MWKFTRMPSKLSGEMVVGHYTHKHPRTHTGPSTMPDHLVAFVFISEWSEKKVAENQKNIESSAHNFHFLEIAIC